MNILSRIANNWTVIRAIYTILGAVVIYQGTSEGQTFAIAFGIYFASMGLFNFGCAAGACYNPIDETKLSKATANIQDIQFEEINDNKL